MKLTRRQQDKAIAGLNTLNKEQLIHLIDSTFPAVLESFMKNREKQRIHEKNGPMLGCWECRTIARRLDLE